MYIDLLPISHGWNADRFHEAKTETFEASETIHGEDRFYCVVASEDVAPRVCVRCDEPIGHAAICPLCEAILATKDITYGNSEGLASKIDS